MSARHPLLLWLQAALKKYPGGEYCGRCGLLNDHFDDCGWFYWFPGDGSENAVCKSCWDDLGLETGER